MSSFCKKVPCLNKPILDLSGETRGGGGQLGKGVGQPGEGVGQSGEGVVEGHDFK